MSNLVSSLFAAAALGAVAVPSIASAGDAAAAAAAASGSACTASRPFYWEIGNSQYPPGDSRNVVVSGQVGGTLYSRTTRFNIASSSKWPFGAYVLERYNGLPPTLIQYGLQMLTGYNSFDQLLCMTTPTVAGCFNVVGNHTQDPNAVGIYFYNGANDQYIASDATLLGLGSYTTAQLTAEVQGQLGITLDYQYPAIAGGMEGSAAEYALFLQKLMRSPADGGLVMHDYLGTHTVATQPCPANESGCSPAGTVPWHYSFNYWIEDSTTSGTLPSGSVVAPGDGAFNSAGAYGFYPWISADMTNYGIVARRSLIGTAYERSVVCGQAIRYAYEGYTPPP